LYEHLLEHPNVALQRRRARTAVSGKPRMRDMLIARPLLIEQFH